MRAAKSNAATWLPSVNCPPTSMPSTGKARFADWDGLTTIVRIFAGCELGMMRSDRRSELRMKYQECFTEQLMTESRAHVA